MIFDGRASKRRKLFQQDPAKGRSDRYDKQHLMKLGSWNAQGFAKKTLAKIDSLGLSGCDFRKLGETLTRCLGLWNGNWDQTAG